MNEAIARESAIKNMHRIQKIQLIVGLDLDWRDLSFDWDKESLEFDESKMKPPTKF